MEFLRCRHCGNIITKLNDSGVKVVCCGENMGVLAANTVDASKEKHVPKLTLAGNVLTVEVGSIPHPMTPEHYIMFIAVENGDKEYIIPLVPEAGKAEAKVTIDPALQTSVYEYCNLHGLWKAELIK